MRISDWSSDVCSSDLDRRSLPLGGGIVQSFLKVMELCTAITRLFTARNQVLNGVAAPFGLTAVQVMALHHISAARSEERRVGKECVSTCRSRWSPYH